MLRALWFSCNKEELKQWMLRITKYADRLLSDLDKLDWPEKVKKMQTDWIGKVYGAEVDFPVEEEKRNHCIYNKTRYTPRSNIHGISSGTRIAKDLATDETREAVENISSTLP